MARCKNKKHSTAEGNLWLPTLTENCGGRQAPNSITKRELGRRERDACGCHAGCDWSLFGLDRGEPRHQTRDLKGRVSNV